MATNRADTLDPALLRPGRLDRKIEFPQPDRRQKRLIFQVGARQMCMEAERMKGKHVLTGNWGMVRPPGTRSIPTDINC